jgi:hypothetical protein
MPRQFAAIELIVGRERGRSLDALESKWRSFIWSHRERSLTDAERSVARSIRKMRKELVLASRQRRS